MAKFHPCAVLPDPSAQQAVVKSINRYGCFYKRANAWRKKHPGPRLFCPYGVTLFKYGQHNWQWHRQIAHRWHHVLNSSQRLAWQVLAELTPYRNYYGDTGYPNGWGLFYKMNRMYLWLGGNYKDNPPATWDALQVPSISGWDLYGTDLILYSITDHWPPPWKAITCVVSRDPMPGSGKFPQHYWNPTASSWNWTGSQWVTDVYLDCPFFHNGQAKSCTVGVYEQDIDSAQFTDFYWIRLP